VYQAPNSWRSTGFSSNSKPWPAVAGSYQAPEFRKPRGAFATGVASSQDTFESRRCSTTWPLRKPPAALNW